MREREIRGLGFLIFHQFAIGDISTEDDDTIGKEAIVLLPWTTLALRPRPGVLEYIRINVDALAIEELTPSQFLHVKEELVDGTVNENFVLELDFEPLTASFPKPTLSKSIGNGVEFLNRNFSAKMFRDKESMHLLLDFLRMHPLLDFLRIHHYKGRFDQKFQEIGLERGWGDTTLRVHDTIQLLLDLLEAPDSCTLEKFLVRGLENEMLQRIKQQGLDIFPRILIVSRLLPDAVGTTCGQRLAEVFGTEHWHIFRVPFRTEKGIVRRWISRFEDAANEISGELRAKPDLVIGNYSDGNIAASLLAHKLGVTQSRTLLDNTSRTQLSLFPVDIKLFMELTFLTLNSTLFLLELTRDQFIYFPYTDEKNKLKALHPEIEDILYSETENTEHIFGGSFLYSDL
ncbi:Sucrose synthase [Bienertia sinuspersici]